MTTTMTDAQLRHERILDVAIQLAEKQGYTKVSRKDIALAADVGAGTVSWHFKGMDRLRTEIVRAAIERKNVKVLAQALVEGHKLAKTAPLALRQKAGQLIAS